MTLDEEQFFAAIQKHDLQKTGLYKELESMQLSYFGTITNSELFRDEIHQQLRIKAIRHKMFKKYEDIDFVKEKHPEALVFEKLKKSMDDSVSPFSCPSLTYA